MIRQLFLGAALAAASGLCQAASGLHLLDAKVDVQDRASLQNGARVFVNHCLSCHALSYMRYNRIGSDLGLSEDQVAGNLMFAADKVVDSMDVAMQPTDAENWFGIVPPDLSVIARARGADYLYSYLVSFYQDDNPARPFGVNNVVLPGVAMPHALWTLQGHQRYVKQDVDGSVDSETVTGLSTSGDEVLVHRSVKLQSGEEVSVTDRLQVDRTGSLQPGEYRAAARDVVNFLVYASEPAQLVRYGMGTWVLAFLAIFFLLTRLLYKEYWKDVH